MSELSTYSEYVYTTDEQVNAIWTLVSAAFILMMQVGTALFNAGSTRKKNVESVFAMKMFETCMGVFGFWWIGYGIAFGTVEDFLGKNL